MITLDTDGKFYYNDSYGTVIAERKEVVGDLIPHLSDELRIVEGATFGQFMSHIFQHYQTYDMVFSSQLGHYNLGLWLDDFNKPDLEDKDTSIDYLEITHAWMEINLTGPSRFGINDVEIYDEFHGVGDWGKDDDGKDQGRGRIALEYTSLNKLKNYPLKLNKEVAFSDANTYKELCKMERYFSVYEVIGTILYEISWSGPPESRDIHWKKIVGDATKSIDELKKNGAQSFSTAEEVFARLDKKIEDFKKKNERT